jgi:hypothetical protein
MSISIPDDRELKVSVKLSAIYMPEVGQANGYYSVFNFAPDPQNLRPINYDNKNNNPKIVFNSGGTQGTSATEYQVSKVGSRVRYVPSLQNAHVVEPLTHPSASSCTFAFGGITPNSRHPIFNLLRGPIFAQYSRFGHPVTNANILSSVTNLTAPNLQYDFSDLDNFQPAIPFIYAYSNASPGGILPSTIALPAKNEGARWSNSYMASSLTNDLSGRGDSIVTYNIWNLVDSNEASLTLNVKEFEGPVGSAVSGKSKASIKTIRDGINGARLFIDSKGKGKSCIVKRIFPTSLDAVFDKPLIFFPTKISATSASGVPYEELLINGEKINVQPSANCGFHIQLSNLNASSSDSNISIIYDDKNPKDNTAYSLTINLAPNTIPQIILKYKKNGVDLFYQYTQIKAPLFDGKATLGYDIFVHFVGTVILVGFSSDQSTWNSIYPEELTFQTANPSDPVIDSKAHIEPYFGQDTSFVRLLATNSSFEMRYSSILFNNYSKPSSVDNVNYETKSTGFITNTLISTDLNLFPANSTNKLLNTKNHILMTFTSPSDKNTLISPSNIENTFHNAKYYGLYGARYTTIPDKTISAMPDWRTVVPVDTATNPKDFVFRKIASSFNSQGIETNKPFVDRKQSQLWGNLFFNGTIEGPAFLSLESPAQNTFQQVDFLTDIVKGELTPWVSALSVTCNCDEPNFSLIKKTASVSLINLDTTTEGLRILELIEKNVLVVTITAGYGKLGSEHTYFQGAITNVNTSRTGSQSNTTLDCVDLGNYIVDNLYFDYIVPFGNRSIKTCIQAIMNFSGFSKYYSLRNDQPTTIGTKQVGGIGGLNLRIVNNPAAAPDAIRATNLDKIGDKLRVFLNKLFELEELPTFRWDERAGFVLDARYAVSNLDTDLKFFGYDLDTKQTYNFRTTGLDSNNKNISIPDWHGLLSGNFSVNTNVNPLSYHVSTYGFTLFGLVEYHTQDKEHDRKMSELSFNNIVNSIVNTGTPVPDMYVGFRKKVIDSLDKNELPTDTLVALKHQQNEFITSRPIHNLSFGCYVTRPLTFHGCFTITAMDGNDVTDVTSKYIYQSVNYNIDKSQNLITAQVTGYAHPWSIRDLQVNGE